MKGGGGAGLSEEGGGGAGLSDAEAQCESSSCQGLMRCVQCLQTGHHANTISRRLAEQKSTERTLDSSILTYSFKVRVFH